MTPAPTPRPATTIRDRAVRAAAPAMLLAMGLLLPFTGKAFTIDDTVFLREAKHALGDPLHPTAFEIVWSEVPRPVRVAEVVPTGPLMAWLLVPAVAAGGSENIAHLVQLVLLLLALGEVAALALGLGMDEAAARRASLLLAASPAVVAMAGTAMPDVAAMTLGLVGIERLVAWRDGGGPASGVAAALGLALAPLARSHALLLVGLAPFLLDSPRKGPAALRQWLPVAAAPLLLVGLALATRDPLAVAASPLKAVELFSSLANLRRNTVALGMHEVLMLPLGLAWMLSRGRRFWLGPWPWVGTALVAVLLVHGGEARWAWIAPVAGCGLAVVADVAIDAIRSGDLARLALVAWSAAALPVLVYLHFPSKYLVPCAPAVVLLASAALGTMPARSARLVAAGVLLAGSVLSLAILRADAAFAEVGRRAAEELVAPRVDDGEKVWINGHWGFQWYAEEAGARMLTLTPPFPSPGDLIVTSKVTISEIPIQAFPRRELLATVTEKAPGGRVLDAAAGAGLYSNAWGYLPWSWGNDELDRFELWRVH